MAIITYQSLAGGERWQCLCWMLNETDSEEEEWIRSGAAREVRWIRTHQKLASWGCRSPIAVPGGWGGGKSIAQGGATKPGGAYCTGKEEKLVFSAPALLLGVLSNRKMAIPLHTRAKPDIYACSRAAGTKIKVQQLLHGCGPRRNKVRMSSHFNFPPLNDKQVFGVFSPGRDGGRAPFSAARETSQRLHTPTSGVL